MKFDEYYRKYYGRIIAFARSYVNDDMVAQDITADSMIKLWKFLKENPECRAGVGRAGKKGRRKEENRVCGKSKLSYFCGL